MTFTPKEWADGKSGGTPITAAELNRIEQGIGDAHEPVHYTDIEGTPTIPSIPAKLSAADARAGTSTAVRTIDAATLKTAVEEHAPAAVADQLAALESRVAALESAAE